MTDTVSPAAVGARADREGPARPVRVRVRPPGPFAVVAGALGLFFAVLSVLAVQSRLERAAVAAATSQPVAPPPRRVLVRRVIETRIVVHVPRAGGGTTTARDTSPAPAPPAPASSAPAPASSAPAPASSAPAPAAAPLTTRSS